MATAIAHASPLPPASGVRRSWFYALTAAPLVRAAETIGRDPRSGFTALNLVLLAGAAVLLVKRVSTVAAVLLAAGPILWWIDKPHPEVFTFGLIAVAFASIGTAPWLTILALGLAAAQEPVIVPALVVAVIFAALPTGFANRRAWIAAGAALLLAVLNPAYQYHATWRRTQSSTVSPLLPQTSQTFLFSESTGLVMMPSEERSQACSIVPRASLGM